jgi:hypothetical protein
MRDMYSGRRNTAAAASSAAPTAASSQAPRLAGARARARDSATYDGTRSQTCQASTTLVRISDCGLRRRGWRGGQRTR